MNTAGIGMDKQDRTRSAAGLRVQAQVVPGSEQVNDGMSKVIAMQSIMHMVMALDEVPPSHVGHFVWHPLS